MKRLATLFGLFALLALLPATALAVEPGCDSNPDSGTGFWEVMKHHADAQRVRDRAYTKIIKQSDSALALSCFDKAMALSSRLGAIFSDIVPGDITAPNITAFFGDDGGNLYNMFGGMGVNPYGDPATLANSYGNMMADQLDSYLNASGNFNQSLSFKLGATATGALQGLVDDITAWLTAASGFISDVRGVLNDVDGVVTQLDSYMQVFNGAVGTMLNFSITINGASYGFDLVANLDQIREIYDNVQQYRGQALAIRDQVRGYLDAADGYVAQMTDLMSSASRLGSDLASMSGLPWADLKGGAAVPAGAGCAYASAFWNGLGAGLSPAAQAAFDAFASADKTDPVAYAAAAAAADAAGAHGVEGFGPVTATDMPYITYSDLVGGPGSGSAEFLGEITGAANLGVINAAKADLDQRLAGARPNTDPNRLVSWKLPTPIPATATSNDVISAIVSSETPP